MSRDERLARRAAQGDRRAFAEIYERYHQDLYRFCLAMVGNPADAQDALQNTMVKVLRSLPGETREIRLKPWLYRIARNEAVETQRRRRDSVELSEEHAGEAVGTVETAEARERLRTLLADLDELPPRQRAAIVMRELAGLGYDQIGASFGCSPAVARQALYEARLALRQLEEGHEMRCDAVMRMLSDADGRVARRRQIRAHLRGCPDCRAFREEIAGRRGELSALAPLPLAASTLVLNSVLGAQAGGGGAAGGLAGSLGAGAGKLAVGSALLKPVAVTAIVAAIGVSAADRAHLIHVPLGGGSGDAPSSPAAPGSETRPTGGGTDVGTAVAGNRARRRGAAVTGAERGTGQSANHKSVDGHAPDEGSNAPPGSRSENGASPPGGGYGRSASERHGAPEGTPPAAEHGQQTARSHRPPHVPPRRGAGGSSPGGAGGHGPPRSAAPVGPAPPRTGRPHTPDAPSQPPPDAVHPGSAEAGSRKGAETAPSELE